MNFYPLSYSSSGLCYVVQSDDYIALFENSNMTLIRCGGENVYSVVLYQGEVLAYIFENGTYLDYLEFSLGDMTIYVYLNPCKAKIHFNILCNVNGLN